MKINFISMNFKVNIKICEGDHSYITNIRIMVQRGEDKNALSIFIVFYKNHCNSLILLEVFKKQSLQVKGQIKRSEMFAPRESITF
ncbi:Uncharacterised protein [Haemophilus pittmaniae]|jgi:hypothetical protein|nr:Uncharacterised protein [Haemophilus pittmaniae]